MKLSFAILVAFACLAFTASSQYVTLTQQEIEANHQLLESLRGFGIGYIAQKGIFESTKVKLPALNFYEDYQVEKTERRSTKAAAYYRFTLLLEAEGKQASVRTTFTIRYDHRNSAYLVSSWRYSIVSQKKTDGFNRFIPIDVRPYNDGTSEDLPRLEGKIQEVVAGLIGWDWLPKSTYTTSFIYFAMQSTGTDINWFQVKLVNAEGQYFRIGFSDAGGSRNVYLDMKEWFRV